jgi:hypothetical protein
VPEVRAGGFPEGLFEGMVVGGGLLVESFKVNISIFEVKIWPTGP